MSRRSEYTAWANMIQRCTNPKHPSFKWYGARGVTVHPPWRLSFRVFLADVGPKPSPELTLERRNNDGNYEPGNVYWATFKAQNNNRRGNLVLVKVEGESHNLSEWAQINDISIGTIWNRRHAGMSLEEAVTLKPKLLGVRVRNQRAMLTTNVPFVPP
jgi:hypothetical protein